MQSHSILICHCSLSVPNTPPTVQVDENTNLQVLCSLVWNSSVVITSVYWTDHLGSVVSNNSTLHVLGIQRNRSGVYTCTIQTASSSSMSTTTVTVLCMLIFSPLCTCLIICCYSLHSHRPSFCIIGWRTNIIPNSRIVSHTQLFLCWTAHSKHYMEWTLRTANTIQPSLHYSVIKQLHSADY